jgi:flavin-dependent dehydrogenase
VGGARFGGIRYHGFGRSVAAPFPPAPGVPAHGLGQRRLHLDAVLFAAARATPGVIAREGARVEAPLVEHGRVKGAVVDGEVRRARLVVAADGPRSILRRRLGLDGPALRHTRLGVRAHFRLAAGQRPGELVDVYVAGERDVYVTPLPDGEVVVAALAPRDAVGERPADFLTRAIAGHSALAAQLEGAEATSEVAGRVPLSLRARRGMAPGLVLLGDAAGTVDPVTGQGIAQALLSAELLAGCLVRRTAPDAPPVFDPSDDVLAEFDRRRRALTRDGALLTRFALTLMNRPALAAGTMRLFERRPAVLGHLVGVAAGLRPLLPF